MSSEEDVSMNVFVDIDGTVCTVVEDGDYSSATPLRNRIRQINRMYDLGHRVVYWTARGSTTGIDWTEKTAEQLFKWGCKFHELRMGKPNYDIWVDDKAVNAESLEDYG